MMITSEKIHEIDQDDMWGKLAGFAGQWKEAMAISARAEWELDRSRIRNVCMAGMGGSAIGADLIRAYSSGSAPCPVYVNRHYTIPAWVNEETLFVACSYSGNTEETLSALNEAVSRGAQIVAVTSGGKLLVEASREGYGYVKIPGGMPPRSALGYSFVPLFRLFHYLGWLDEPEEVLDQTAALLEEQGELLADLENSRALTIAKELRDTLPVIYTGEGLMEPVGTRWRCQLGENSKMMAHSNVFPEMNHNEIVGWEQMAHLTGRLSVILLEDEEDHSKVKQRMQIVQEMVQGLAVSVMNLKSTGESRLARQFSLIQLGDWVSVYVALLSDVDPTPIAKIDLLKSRLAEL